MRVYLISKKALIVILRWLLFFVAAYLVVSSEKRWPALFVPLLGLFAASNLTLGFVSPERFRLWRLNYFVVVFDVLFISAMIYLTGDLDLYIFYFFTILMASYGRQIQGSLLVAVLASGFYVWMAVRTGSVQTLLSPELLIRIPFFYLVALISSFMVEESRAEEERLTWTRIILGMTQDLAAARDRDGVLAILRQTLSRFPGVRDVRVFTGSDGDFRRAGNSSGADGRRWPASAFGIGTAAPGSRSSRLWFRRVSARTNRTRPRCSGSPSSRSRRTRASKGCCSSIPRAPRSSASGCARFSASPP